MFRKIITGLAMAAVALPAFAADHQILNVSYDPTRELYTEFNKAFADHWKKENPQDSVSFRQSHGGSGRQARSVIDGIDADVVTLALAYDVDAIAERGFLNKDWQARLPDNSAPYTSTIVFLVRKGNPKGIRDWDDLVRQGVQVITPNPKTSGGARWNYLAAWHYAKVKNGSDEAAAEFVQKLLQNVPVLDTGARGSTVSFVERGLGDVLLAWENEAYLSLDEFADKFEIVTPSISILAEPSIAVVDRNVDRKGSREIATAYLEYLYSDEGQEIAAKHFYRPRNQKVAEKYKDKFARVELFTIDDAFDGWQKAQAEHFGDGGTFDQIYKK